MREPVRLNPVSSVVERARAYFRTEVTRPYAFRLEKLRALEASLRKNEQKVFDALKADLGKPLHEAYPAEVGIVYADMKHVMRKLKSWMKPQPGSASLLSLPARGYRYPEPLGTTLIVAPWNYPFQLAIAPLVGAIAAGCNAVLKPSELSPATSKVIEEVVRDAFGDDGYVTVVQGGIEESKALLAEKWDLVFFTGSTRVGQSVMEAAAKHLTPVVLELGGKSPVIVDENVDLDVTARRIAWGKMYNCGQTCIAPDYLLVHKGVKAALIEKMAAAFKQFFGDDIAKSPDYGRIISERHFKRLQSLMAGGKVAFGGQCDEQARFMAPTLLTDVNLSHPLMQEEIFGPLLPIIEVNDVAEAIRFVNERPKPLALYVFSKDSSKSEEVLRRVSAGGAVVNDVIFHITTDMPFGGVGDSGTGAYHGKASFDAFSHYKSVLKKPFMLDLALRYPPYKAPISLFRRLLG